MPFIEHNGKRVLFIHIPKTGGTSVQKWMENIAPVRLFSVGVPASSRCTPQHYRMQDITALLGEGYFDFVFTVVRNPYDRIESEYKMRAQLAREGFWAKMPKFSTWLEESLLKQKQSPFFLDNHLRPQWEFLSNEVRVFKLEEGLRAPLDEIARFLGVHPAKDIPHRMKSEKLEIEWQVPDRVRVREHYASDFEMFGYEI